MSEDLRRLGDPSSASFQVARYPFYVLNATVAQYNRIIEARLREIGLDIPTWRVLMILGERAPRSLGEIAQSAVINLTTMIRIIQRMERADLVETRSDPVDARVRLVDLRESGQRQIAAARAVTAPIYQEMIAGFSQAEFADLLSLLGRLRENLERL